MKNYIYFLSCILLLGTVSCNEEAFDKLEHYKYVVYLLSHDSYNVYPATLSFGDEGESVTGYVSVGCGGSLTNPEGFTVELEADNVLFNVYNKGNFDIDTTKYAKLLPKDRYSIENMSIDFPAKNPDQYVKVPIKVNMDGLSPDSIYFIPLAIKNTSKYELNPEKSNVLFRVVLHNAYADQLKSSYYQMRGSILNDNGDATGTVSATKLAKPLSKKSIRMFAGNVTEAPTSTVAVIQQNALILTINDNKEVTIKPYGTIQVEQFPVHDNWNTYEEVISPADESKVIKYIYLHYRYRTLKTPATQNTPAEYNDWVYIKETMYRVED